MSKEQPKLTPWFPASVKPAREGVYQCNYDGSAIFRLFLRGDWYCYGHTAEEAARTRVRSDNAAKWRGLAVKP